MTDFLPAPATLPEGQRVYAIGDIHGCLDKLLALHAMIARDMADRPIERITLIHMGDYIDRGPDTAGVLEWLLGADIPPADIFINLMGNHEDLMLEALQGGQALESWLDNGAVESLESWGADPDALISECLRHIPEPHIEFLRNLTLSHRVGPYFFVHAGIRPGVPLDRQDRHDMLWIREPFHSSPADHGAIIVHGHTPTPKVIVRPNRIGIDTGAVKGGLLTCLVLEDDRMGLMQV